jgi:arabinofuranosyltransferase
LFATLYYGFPFPNTAYAKLNSHIPRPELLLKGLSYLSNSLRLDPVTLPVIAAGLFAAFFKGSREQKAFGAGAVLYIVYVVWIGGDFMSGRFLTAPFLMSVCFLAVSPLLGTTRKTLAVSGAVFVLAFVGPYAPFLPDVNDRRIDGSVYIDSEGIADERGYYYKETGLLPYIVRRISCPENFDRFSVHPWALDAYFDLEYKKTFAVRRNVGFYGYFAGPGIRVLDRWALCDPLLARIPYKPESGWRPGHFERRLPAGYKETLATGENQIADKNLSLLYDKLKLVTEGDLFTSERFYEIARFNLGFYSGLADTDNYQ